MRKAQFWVEKCHSSPNLFFLLSLLPSFAFLVSLMGSKLTLTLKMTLHRLSKVWSLSTTINSPNQNYIHQNDQVPSNNDMTPGLASTVLSKRWLFL